MKLVELTEKDRLEYNNFVAQSAGGSFLQSWEWGRWQEAMGRKVYRLKIKDESGEWVASAQLIKMPLHMDKYYLYCPYGPVLAAGENFQFPISNFLNETQKKFVDAVFVRIEPKNINLSLTLSSKGEGRMQKTKNIQPGKTLVVDLNKTQEELLGEMHHKTRYNIRLAEKHGVEVQDEFVLTVGKGLYAKEAVELIAKTSRRQGFKAQSADYFEKLISYFVLRNKTPALAGEMQSGQSFEALAKEGAVQNSGGDVKLHIYKALYNKELLASAIIIDFSSTRTYLFGGSSEENKNIMAPYLLHWQAMLDAKRQNLSAYDFWGIETAAGDTPGFVRFKLGFSSSPLAIKQYAGAYDYVINPLWYKAYKVLRFINRILKRGF